MLNGLLLACLQVVQPLLTEPQGLHTVVAAAGLHGAAARACFCCCWLLLHRNEPIFHTLPVPAAVPALQVCLAGIGGVGGAEECVAALAL